MPRNESADSRRGAVPGQAREIRVQYRDEDLPKNPDLAPPPEEFAKLLFDAIKRHGLQRRVIVQSFDFRTLHVMKKLDPKIRLSALYEGKPKSFVEIATEAGAPALSPRSLSWSRKSRWMRRKGALAGGRVDREHARRLEASDRLRR